jgi:hypothetical protein
MASYGIAERITRSMRGRAAIVTARKRGDTWAQEAPGNCLACTRSFSPFVNVSVVGAGQAVIVAGLLSSTASDRPSGA